MHTCHLLTWYMYILYIHVHNYIVGEDMVTCNTMLYHLSYMHQLSYIYMYTCTMYIYIYSLVEWYVHLWTNRIGPPVHEFSALPVSLPVHEFSACVSASA